MAVDIKGLFGQYSGTNNNQKVIKHGKVSKVKSDRIVEEKRADTLVETLSNQKDSIEISEEGRNSLKEQHSAENKKFSQSFDTVDSLSKYLYENFNIVKQGMAEISSKYLRYCLTDTDKRKSLFENLKAADKALEEKQGQVGFQSMKIKIDDDGEVTMESSSKSVSVNEQKRRRQIAAAATRGDMQAIIALLEQDLQEVEAGLKENACDEREVEKVKALLSEAKQKLSSLPDREATPEEQAIMMMNTLM